MLSQFLNFCKTSLSNDSPLKIYLFKIENIFIELLFLNNNFEFSSEGT